MTFRLRRRPDRRGRSDRLVSAAVIAGVFVLWFLLGMPGCQPEPPVSGNAIARDGDTIEIGGETFRLSGVDALEFNQTCSRDGATWPCGREAARALAGHIRGRTLTCLPEGKDRYGRTLARCAIAGADIGEWLVENGLAFDSSRFGLGRYAGLEREAAKARRGAWAGEFIKPWVWREHPAPRMPDAPS
jgi:endonuclease YncB( thermonuclease family)